MKKPFVLHAVALFAAVIVTALAPHAYALLGCMFIPTLSAFATWTGWKDRGYERFYSGNNRCVIHMAHAVLIAVAMQRFLPGASLAPVLICTFFGVAYHFWAFYAFAGLEKRNLPFLVGPHPHKYVLYIRRIPELKKTSSTGIYPAEAFLAVPALGTLWGLGERLVLPASLAASAVVLALFVYRYHVLRSVKRHADSGLYLQRLKRTIYRLHPQVLLHFAGNAENYYQAHMWLGPVANLDESSLLIVRQRGAIKKAQSSPIPVLYVHTERDVEYLIPSCARVALYTGNSNRNLVVVRLPHLRSVFVGHGDSDKASSANPVSRMYYRIYVAGQAAIDRYMKNKVGIPHETFEVVGRPQLSSISAPRERKDDAFTVLYAPTWEGWPGGQNYCSLKAVAPKLRSLVKEFPRAKIIFKPHPHTGQQLPEYRKLERDLATFLRENGHEARIGLSHNLYKSFNDSDVLISDISSVVSDYLASGKPILLSNPMGMSLERFVAEFPVAEACYLLEPNASDLTTKLALALQDDPKREERKKVAIHTLGNLDEPSSEVFRKAVSRLYAEAVEDFPIELDSEERMFIGAFQSDNCRAMLKAGWNTCKQSTDGLIRLHAPLGHADPHYFAAGDEVEILAVRPSRLDKGRADLVCVGQRSTVRRAGYHHGSFQYWLDIGLPQDFAIAAGALRIRVRRAPSGVVIAGELAAPEPSQEALQGMELGLE